MNHSLIKTRSRRGVGSVVAGVDLNSVFRHVAEAADRGAEPAGQIADFLISLGVTVDGVRQVLNTVATSSEITGAERAYIEGEIRALNYGYAPGFGRGGGLILALLAIGAVVALNDK